LAIAAFYGVEVIENLNNPCIPEFVIVHGARRATHFALAALAPQQKSPRKIREAVPPAAWQSPLDTQPSA
jgi:hypothetical protein